MKFKKWYNLVSTKVHCVKSVHIRSYSGPYFPTFGLNTDRYGVSLRIQSKCGKIRTRITPNTYTFYAVVLFGEIGKHVDLIGLLHWRFLMNTDNVKTPSRYNSIATSNLPNLRTSSLRSIVTIKNFGRH